jgi:hypothetical protein
VPAQITAGRACSSDYRTTDCCSLHERHAGIWPLNYTSGPKS